MKFALIIDSIGDGKTHSFYVKNNQAFNFEDDKPYSPDTSLGSKCFISTYNYPWLFEEGYFLNWSDFKHDLPDLDLDLIFIVRERSLARTDGFYDGWCEVDNIRNKYPNAKVVAFLKETWVGIPYEYKDPRHLARIDFLNECDTVLMNRPEDMIGVFQNLKDYVDKPFNFVGQPHNIKYFYENFAGENNQKDVAIWAYLPSHPPRRANTYKFAIKMSQKFNIPVRYKPLRPGQDANYLPLRDFIEQWSSCAFHFNLDPIRHYPGKQVVHTASVGTINIGGVNDNHFLLYPETATCDTNILEQRFTEYVEDDTRRNEVMSYAWNRLNEIFSFDSVRKQIENMRY